MCLVKGVFVCPKNVIAMVIAVLCTLEKLVINIGTVFNNARFL